MSIQDEIVRLTNSEAGKALASLGFKATHQGGGIVNFERPDGQGGREHVISGLDTDAYGPILLDEPVLLVDDGGSEKPFPSLPFTRWSSTSTRKRSTCSSRKEQAPPPPP